jgi:hypothetical protein
MQEFPSSSIRAAIFLFADKNGMSGRVARVLEMPFTADPGETHRPASSPAIFFLIE